MLRLISEKNQKAFLSFYDRYIRLIYKFVFQALNDQATTDDLIQDFWMKIWENPSFLRCDDQGSSLSYMMGYLRFRILDVYRDTLKKMVSIEQLMDNDIEFSGFSTPESMEDELVRAICEALDKQPYIVRKTFWLRINDWSVDESAEILSVNKKTVYNKYSESLSIVRTHLKKNYPDLIEEFNSGVNRKKIFSLRFFLF